MRKPCLKVIIPAICLLFAFHTSTAQQVVISQVYGGGGNTGATLTHDFIELFNRGNTPVSLAGWSVQYASATGGSWAKTDLTAVTLQPGQYYLIQEAQGAGGTTALPTPDVIGTISMSGTAGKVALVNSTTVITTGTTCPAAGIIDFVGFGPTANCSETSPTAVLSNTTAAIRAANGCTDANNNSTDFATGAPTPRNTASPLSVCGAPVTTVSVAAGTNAAEPATNGTFTVSLSAPAPAGGITVTYTLGGSASAGDYSDALAGSISIGETQTSGTITLVPVDDADFEGTETITITLTGATSPYTIATGNAVINLNDNDAPPTVSVAAGISAAEPGTDGTFTLTLSSPAPAGGVTITYTLGGTAGSGDYTDPAAGTITIPQSSTTGTVTLDVIDDPDAEPVETITITLNTVSSPYTIATGNASINLTSDDFAPIALTTGVAYTQNFNTLANTGTLNSLFLPGWQLDETGNGARDNELYAADNGGSNTGDTYSYGSTGSTERALGSLLSGSLVSKYGAYFINQTGGPITSLRVTYTGEQWRLGTINRTDRVDFQYSLDAASVVSGNWINFDQLDFISPVTTAAGAKDGNLPANRTAVAYTINGLLIPAGSTFFIRFQDTDASGADDGLAIDDLTVEANPVDNAGPAIIALSPAPGATDVALSAVATITFDEDIQAGAGNIYVKRTSDNAVVQTVNIGATTLAVNKVSFTLNGVAYGTGYYIEVDAGAVSDVNSNSFAGISGSAAWSFTTEPPPPPGVIGFTYTFDACTSGLTDGFKQYSAVGDVVWTCTTFGRDAADPTGQASLPNGVQINGFSGGTNVPNVDWLISPPFDLTGTTFPLLSFWSRTAFNGLPLELLVSVNYNGGDPAAATWTPLNGRFPQQTSNTWTLSSDINLSAFKQPNVHFAFVYTSSEDDGARWTLDDITVINSLVPPPPSLTVSTADIQFTYVAAGGSADKTFTFTGNDLTSGVTLTSTGAFTLSKDGGSFSNAISYTIAEANNIPQTVHVRFAPPVQNQNFTGTITVSSGSLEETISVGGSSIDPATTLEVVNWNIEWFGSPTQAPTNDNQQEQHVRTILQSIGADVYAVSEIVDESRLASVVSSMPGYAYVISNYGSHTNTTVNPPSALGQAQKLAFIYNTSVISNVTTTALLSQGINSAADITNPAYNYYASGRFPYMMSADVTLNCVTRNVKFILVHAKANTSPTATSYDRRKRGADTLHYTLQQDYANEHVIILGDFNDDLDVTITAGINPPVTSYSSFINDPANFTPVTLPLSLAGKKSTVSYNDVIDHAIVSNEMAVYYMTGTAAVLTDVTSLVPNYAGTTSDHYPVFHRYVFPNTTGPQVTVCPEAGPFCAAPDNQYTIPAFVATDDCDPVIYSYEITGATQRTGTTNNASGTFNSGISTINWTATDSWGNSVTCQTTVTVGAGLDLTIPDAFALPYGVLPNTVYIGYEPASSLTLTANASGGAGGYSYSWTGGATSASVTVDPLVTTTYTVTVVDANNCQASASKTVDVMDIRENRKSKKVLICHKPNGQNATKIVNVNAVQAHLDHGDMLGSCVCPPDPSRPAPATDEAEEGPVGLDVTGYPNPSSAGFQLTIRGVDWQEMVQLRVTDMQGRVIEQRTGLRAGQTIQLGAAYRAGTYFAEVSSGKAKRTIKLVKL